jgi:murein DD-endopeptidase MepM/ murein hydrolase activator NlpD
MIAELVRSSCLAVIVYVIVRHISGREMATLVKWLAIVSIALMIMSAISEPLKQFANDIHYMRNTYQEITGAGTHGEQPGYLDIWERSTGATWDMPLQGEITQPFKGEEHHGIDIAGDIGDLITVVRTGKVEKISTNEVYGLYVIVNHGGGFQSLYAHCSEVVVKEGERIMRWQKIASVGSSGDSTGSHLHFEIRLNGIAQNPADYLSQ